MEIPFAIHITGAPLPIPVYFVGFIDCVLYNHLTDRYIVTDLKTTRQHLDDATPKYQFDEQTTPYGIILEHILGRPIEEIEVAYLECYIDLLEPTIKMLTFKRTLDDLLDWKRGMFEDIERFSRFYNATWFPRVTKGDACLAYNRPCQFFDICYTRQADVLNKLIAGEPRSEMFSTGAVPWVTAEMPFERL